MGFGIWDLGFADPRVPTPDPRSPIPDPRPPNPDRPAFTLIELLIVISIMMILVALTATMMRPDVKGRRVREAARGINVYLASARNRATETGRPCGVIFRNFGAPGFAMNADQCEVPPSFCGESELSAASLLVVGTLPTQAIEATLNDVDGLPPNMVRPGDLIQFNCQGPMYRILDASGTPANILDNGFVIGSPVYAVVADVGQNTLVPWSDAIPSQPVPYRIFRAPIKGFAQPLQLPAATVVDLGASGYANVVPGARDFTVMFSPNGAVECVYINAARHSVVDPIYLLVGKRERVENDYIQDNPNEDTLTNYQDLGNRWVTINPQTGAVQTEPVASCAGVADWDDAIIAARLLASEALGMGGK